MTLFDQSEHFEDETWFDAWRIHVRVVSALIRRETRAHFGETRLGYLWAVIEPGLHLIAYIILFNFIFARHTPVGRSLTLFLLTGMVPYFLYQKVSTYVAGSVSGNRSLLNLPPVKVYDVMVARAILEACTYLFVGVLMFTALWFSGVAEAVPRDPITLIEAIAVIFTFGFGLGAINAVLRVYITNWEMFFSRLSAPLWMLSGIWFVPSEVPRPFRDYLLYNPLAHFITWFRYGFYPPYEAYLDRNYAIWVSGCTLLLGLVLQRVARRKLLEPQ